MNNNQNELIDSIDELNYGHDGIEFKFILYAIGMLLSALLLCAPKIYIASSIYYASVQTNQLLNNYKSLKEENSHLKKKVEVLQYHNDIETSLKQ